MGTPEQDLARYMDEQERLILLDEAIEHEAIKIFTDLDLGQWPEPILDDLDDWLGDNSETLLPLLYRDHNEFNALFIQKLTEAVNNLAITIVDSRSDISDDHDSYDLTC